MRTGWKVRAILGLSLALTVVPVATADEQAGSNIIAGSAIYDGIMGSIGQLTDIPTVNTMTFVHAGQIDVGPSGGDFLGVGVKNGEGTLGGHPDCADDYGAHWSGYADGALGGVYFCYLFAVDSFGVDSYPTFKIEHASCSGGSVIWNMWLSGTLRVCKNMGVNAGTRVMTLLETVGPSLTDRNIDVRFTNLMWSLTGSSSWNSYGNPGAGGHSESFDYRYLYSSVTSHYFYMTPLD